MRAQELVDRVLRVLEVAEHPRLGGAGLAAGGGEPLRDPVVAEAALVHRLGARVDEAAAVGAGLHAVAAAEAVRLVHEHDPVRALEGRAHRADLHAGRVRAVVAQLGDEEVLRPVAGAVLLGEAVVAPVRRVDLRALDVPVRHVVALDPGPEVVGLARDVVLLLAGPHAVAAADALLDVDGHRPPVVGRLVVRGGLGLPAQDGLEGQLGGPGQEQQLGRAGQEVPTVGAHFVASFIWAGWWATWQVVQASPPAWSASSTCGNLAGRATFAAWQRAQSTLAVGALRLLLGRVPGVSGERAVAGLAADRRVAAALHGFGHVGVALDARGAPGEGHRPHPVLLERPGPVVAVDAEALRDEKGLQDEEGQDPGREQPGHPEEVSLVPEEHSHDDHLLIDAGPVARGSRRPGRCRENRMAQEARSGCDDRKKRTPGQEPNGSCRGIKLSNPAPRWTPAAASPKLGPSRGER